MIRPQFSQRLGNQDFQAEICTLIVFEAMSTLLEGSGFIFPSFKPFENLEEIFTCISFLEMKEDFSEFLVCLNQLIILLKLLTTLDFPFLTLWCFEKVVRRYSIHDRLHRGRETLQNRSKSMAIGLPQIRHIYDAIVSNKI